MSERWRELLGRLSEEEPDRDRVAPHPGERRLGGGEPSGHSRLVAAAVAAVLAVTSFVFVRSAFDDGSDGVGPVATGASEIDPAEVCDVPEYDPTIALLGEIGYPEVVLEPGPLVVPLGVLEAPGVTPDQMEGDLGEALRAYVASPQAVHAPPEGWRVVVEDADKVIMAAPEPTPMSWWVTKFVLTDAGWEGRVEEIVEQHPTPAQRGYGLELRWTGDLVLEDGSWASTLELVNPSDSTWVDPDENQGGEFSAEVAVFDSQGEEIGHKVDAPPSSGFATEIAMNGARPLPIALGGAIGSLAPGTLSLVACVPPLGLASPLGTLVVDRDPIVPDVEVLTYPFSGDTMWALGGGILTMHQGCLAVSNATEDGPRTIVVITIVVWPDGYALVRRAGDQVLIDATGEALGSLGDEVRLVGGYGNIEQADSAVIGGVPESCRTTGESYFITGGLAEIDPG